MNVPRASLQVDFRVVHAFVRDGSGGNPAGVVLDARQLSRADKQLIAAQAGLPETAFVMPSDRADLRLEFYTPTREIANCGHATVATLSLLRQLGELNGRQQVAIETLGGVRAVMLEGDDAFLTLDPPSSDIDALKARTTCEQIARSLCLPERLLLQGDEPCLMSTGNRFLLVHVPDEEQLARVQPEQSLIHDISETLDLIGFYVYTTPTHGTARATTRMFAPRYGIEEEAGTGMAAGPLGCRLWQLGHVRTTSFEIEQGRYMPKPSVSKLIVRVGVDNGGINAVAVGGSARVASQRVFTL